VAEFVAQSTKAWVSVRSPDAARLAALLTAQGARVEQDGDGALHVFDADATAIGELAYANGVMLHELAPRQGSLEEAFLLATGAAQEYRAVTELPPPVAS
jgi:ABC-2 type transport system ATP-binding protein